MYKLVEGAPFERVLAIGAHPDDVELGAGGLVSRLGRRGARVVIAVASVPSNVETRLAEAERAAAVLGAELVDLTGRTASRVEALPMHALVARLDALVADVRPDLVLTHTRDDVHWDHGLVHHASIAALRRAHADVLAFQSTARFNPAPFAPQCFADISGAIETKLEAVRAHTSQVLKGTIDLASCRDLARSLGRLCGVEYAEGFQVLRLTF